MSAGAIFVRWAEAPALVVAFWRCALASAVLLPLAGRRLVREWERLERRDWLAAALAGFFLALHFATWIASLDYTTVASSVVLVATTPVWVALLGRWFGQPQVSRGTALGIAICLAGAVAIGAGDLALAGEALLGDALALAGAVAIALYFLIGRRIRPRLTILSYLSTCYGAASVFLGAFVAVAGEALLSYPAATYGWMLALALVPQLIGHSCFNWALAHVSPVTVATFALGEPVFAALLAWALLAEDPPWTALAGGAVLLGGIALTVRSEEAAAAASEPPPAAC